MFDLSQVNVHTCTGLSNGLLRIFAQISCHLFSDYIMPWKLFCKAFLISHANIELGKLPKKLTNNLLNKNSSKLQVLYIENVKSFLLYKCIVYYPVSAQLSWVNTVSVLGREEGYTVNMAWARGKSITRFLRFVPF